MSGEKRKYLPAEGYRFLVLLALSTPPGRAASKGELAWETRANHYMITRVLRELAAEGLVAVDARGDGGYVVRATAEGRAFAAESQAYVLRSFRDALALHFRYGRAPAWARPFTT